MKKIIAFVLAMVLVAVASIGATLAYLTDTDYEVNTFTYGNVSIDLTETFDEENAKLLPSTGSAQDGTLENGVKKEVYVENTGSEDAYVRVHIAIPAILDDGAETFDASQNILHFNYPKESIGAGLWDWSDSTGAPYEGNWNAYTTTIDGNPYNVYVVTHEGKLVKNQKTGMAMSQVYLDSKVTNEQLAIINDALSGKWNIYVYAEGAQAEGFDNAYAALNAAFGAPGYEINWTGAVAQ